MYRPSQQLADIFIKNGFKDITAKKFPNNYSKTKSRGYYSPEDKGYFMYPSGSHVTFDHHIYVAYRNGYFSMGDHIDHDQLVSLIAYCKLSSDEREKLNDMNITPNMLKSYYEKSKAEEEEFRREDFGNEIGPFEKKIIAVYDSVIL